MGHLVLQALERQSLELGVIFIRPWAVGVQPLPQEQGHIHGMSSNLPLSFWTPEGYHCPCAGACSGGGHREARRWAKKGTMGKEQKSRAEGPVLTCRGCSSHLSFAKGPWQASPAFPGRDRGPFKRGAEGPQNRTEEKGELRDELSKGSLELSVQAERTLGWNYPSSPSSQRHRPRTAGRH